MSYSEPLSSSISSDRTEASFFSSVVIFPNELAYLTLRALISFARFDNVVDSVLSISLHTGSIHFSCKNVATSASDRFSMASTVLSISYCFAILISLFVFVCSFQSATIFSSFAFVSGSTSALGFALAFMAALSKALSFSASQ